MSDPTEERLKIFCHFGCPEHRGGNCTCRNQEALRHYRKIKASGVTVMEHNMDLSKRLEKAEAELGECQADLDGHKKAYYRLFHMLNVGNKLTERDIQRVEAACNQLREQVIQERKNFEAMIVGLKAQLALAAQQRETLSVAYDKAEAERIRLQQYEKFVRHIEAHLEPGQVVVCKICGKSMHEIEHDTEAHSQKKE